MNDVEADKKALSILQTQEFLGYHGSYLCPDRKALRQETIESLLELVIDPQQRKGLLALYEENSYFNVCPAGAKHHHWWWGGLRDHTLEVIGIASDLLGLYDDDLTSVRYSDIVVAGFLHDFSKVWQYKPLTTEEKDSGKYHKNQEFKRAENGVFDLVPEETKLLLELAKFDVKLTEMQWSAVLFAEGGWSDAGFGWAGRANSTLEAVFHKNPLATILHMADLYSANVLGKGLE